MNSNTIAGSLGGGALLVVLVALALPVAQASSSFVSYASIRDDATLRVGRRHVRLHGIHVPSTGRHCQTFLRPVRCASRAVNALEFKIQGFVECHPISRYRDRSVSAVCFNKGEDLGAYLIDRGWAVAAPGAPFEYTVLERIARTHHRGVWGVSVKAAPRRR